MAVEMSEIEEVSNEEKLAIKSPIALKVILVLTAINFIYIAGYVLYFLYLAYLADSGSLSTWQYQFLQGAGFDPGTYSYNDHAKYTGIVTLPLFFSLTNFLFALFKKPNMLMVSLIISIFIFKTGPIGFITGIICFFLLLIPSTRKYFKNIKIAKDQPEIENV